MTSTGDGEYRWFDEWVATMVGITVGVTDALGTVEVLNAFGADEAMASKAMLLTMREAVDGGSGSDWVLVGSVDQWLYTVSPSRPDSLALVARLAGAGTAALATWTGANSLLAVATAGELRSGIDLDVPHLRYGPEPALLDRHLQPAQVTGEQAVSAGDAARLIGVMTGLRLTPQLLDMRNISLPGLIGLPGPTL